MAKQEIAPEIDRVRMRRFVRALLEDVHALERMLEEGRIESGVRRIGAEQEMFLVDRSLRPAKGSLRVLERLGDPRFTTELGLFNLEANLTPRDFGGSCLSRMEAELGDLLREVKDAAAAEGLQVLLCGILPTLEKEHLGDDWITPIPRYLALNRLMRAMRGERFHMLIKGADELETTQDNVMLEACNTSFQVHFQVGPGEFAPLYNLAQVVAAPVLAVAANSPVLLQRRLWHETRVALFQQSVDTRSEAMAQRGRRQRVSFGDRWVERSVLEIFRDDVARFRSLIAGEVEESSLAVLDRGEVPDLAALRLHNGTVYRWNRPCYGVRDGKAHLRIEARALPAGPTVRDEVANAAFYFGLMASLGDEYGDVTRAMAFDDARANFLAAARYGLQSRFRWVRGRSTTAEELVLTHLLPLAREGLASRGIDGGDADRSLGILEERVRRGRTGAQWALDSLASMGDRGRPSERYHALTASMAALQESGEPVSGWPLATLAGDRFHPAQYRTVGQLMTEDVFTVHPDDVVDLAASLMEWEHLRHVPVEDDEGNLVGLVSHRTLLRMLARAPREGEGGIAVSDVMRADVVTVSPETPTLEAIDLMRRHRVGSLPVVRDGRLVGILTEHDFLEVSGWLLERWLRGDR